MKQERKIKIKSLDIYTPILKEFNGNNITKIENDDFYIDNYLHFPVLLNKDMTQWEDANRYLLYKIKEYKLPDPKTLDKIASDLLAFKIFCEKNDIDYLSAPRRTKRPNWLYREYLLTKNYSDSYFKRKIGAVDNFYDWLIDHENHKFKYVMSTTTEEYIPYKDKYGFTHCKKVKSKDITKTPHTQNHTVNDDSIIDGGKKLYPLTKEEQLNVLNAIKKTNNIEMILAFYIAIFTGARSQTIFTLRLKHFEHAIKNTEKVIKIKIGYETDCDTKYSKINTLFFPAWLYKKIQIYIKSPRATKKRNKSKHIFDNHKLSYLFLSNQGKPYYAAKSDPYRKLYSNPPEGSTVRKFITTTLKKVLKQQNTPMDFSFHDLRATYGMNYVDAHMFLVKEGKLSISQLLSSLSERMGHSDIKVTERYLNFRSRNKLREEAQDFYELELREMLNV